MLKPNVPLVVYLILECMLFANAVHSPHPCLSYEPVQFEKYKHHYQCDSEVEFGWTVHAYRWWSLKF